MLLGGPIFPLAFQLLVARLEIPRHGDQKKRGRSGKKKRVALFYGIHQLFALPALFYCEETTILFKWLIK